MLKFIYGPTGSGKTEMIHSGVCRDVRSGKNVILLVPEQEVLKTERKLAEMLEGENSLGLEVVSFRRLCNRIFREYGGLCKNYISRGGRTILMWRALRSLAGSLVYFSGSDPSDTALIERLLSFTAQMKSYKITPARFESSAEALPESILRAKAVDLAAIYSAYDALVHESYDDDAEDTSAAHELLLEHGFFPGCSVYIDSFYGFTPDELDLISDIFAGCEDVTVSLLWDNEKPASNYERSEITRKQLRRAARDAGREITEKAVEGVRRFSSPVLSELSRVFWDAGKDGVAYNGDGSVRVIKCADVYDEASWIAADVRRRVRENGLRYRDIAVIGRDPSSFVGVLDVALEAQGIPFHMSRREDVTAHPMARMITSALRVLEYGWRRADVISYMKTGIPRIGDREADLLEKYAQAWNINGRPRWCEVWNMNPNGFSLQMSEKDRRMLDSINESRVRLTGPLEDLFDRLESADDLSSSAECLYRFMEESGAKESIAGPKDAAVWNAVCSALEDISECGRGEVCDLTALSRIVRCVFGYTGIGSIPSSADEVTVAGASLARVGTVKAVYLVSANDAVFPAEVKDDDLLDKNDVDQLAKVGIVLENYTDSRANDELMYFYRSAFCASDWLTVSYCAAGGSGGSSDMSIGCRRILDVLSNFEETDSSSGGPGSRLEYGEYALRRAGEFAGTATGDLLAEYFGERLPSVSGAPLSRRYERLAPETTDILYSDKISLSQSKIEMFNACPFGYLCNYVLRLSDSGGSRFNPAEIGEFVHSVLEQYFSGKYDVGEDAEIIRGKVEEIVEDYIERGAGGKEKLDARTAAMFERIKRTSVQLVLDINAELSVSDFKPAFFELPIGSGEGCVEPIKVKLEDGSDVVVNGKIDRVDVAPSGDDLYVRIVDYKTSEKDKELKPGDAAKGENLQMPLYLFSICDNENSGIAEKLGCRGKLIPAAMEYYAAHDPLIKLDGAEDIKKYRDSDEPVTVSRTGFFVDEGGVRGAYDRSGGERWLPNAGKSASVTPEELENVRSDVYAQLTSIGERIKNGEAFVRAEKSDDNPPCKYCKFRSMCRKEIV